VGAGTVRHEISAGTADLVSDTIRDKQLQYDARNFSKELLNQLLTDEEVAKTVAQWTMRLLVSLQNDIGALFVRILAQEQVVDAVNRLADRLVAYLCASRTIQERVGQLLVDAICLEASRNAAATWAYDLVMREDVTCGFRDLVVAALQTDAVINESRRLGIEIVNGVLADPSTQDEAKRVLNETLRDGELRSAAKESLWTIVMPWSSTSKAAPARSSAEEEAERRRKEEEERLRIEAEEAERKRQEAEERLRKEAEEAERKQREEEEAEQRRREAEETERRKQEAEEAGRKRMEAERRQREAEEAERKRRAAEEADRKRREAEEAERRQREAEEAERKRRKAEEAEARRREAEETARRQREAAENERRRREAEEAKRRQQEAEAERARREAEDLERKRREAERARREAEEIERKRREAEAEMQRRRDEADRLRQEEEDLARLQAENAGMRRAAEKKLERATGLPPREKVAEPQKAMMAAMMAQPPAKPAKPNGPCDKCDGKHDTDACPHFKKARDKHADAWQNYGSKGSESASAQWPVLRRARVVPQPGDGSCLFHSLSYGLRGTNASRLRAEIAEYIAKNPNTTVANNPIKDWVLWDTGMDTSSYASRMRTGSQWGGAVELAVCAKMRSVHVHVYERGNSGFKRISSFEGDAGPGAPVVSLCYGGRVHYDALEV